MITGFNTDVDHQGRVFHVQTEDKGLQNPVVESLIYCGGEIIASRSESYAELTENGRPFFSRTIGLSSTGEPVDLIAGGKLTGRAGPWTIGIFGVEQGDFADVSAGSIGVARIYRQIFKDSTIGGIATYGDPNSNLDNSVLGFDYQYRNTTLIPGCSLEGEFWYQRSRIRI